MKKDIIFKLLFAIEIALLPLILASHYIFPDWIMGIFVSVLLLAKIAIIIIKNPANVKQLYLDAIGNVIVIDFLLISYACLNYIPVVLTVLGAVLFSLEETLKVYFYYKPNNDFVSALNFTVEMFMFVTLSALMFVTINLATIKVAVIALIISSSLLVAIQTYNLIYYYILKKNKRSK